MGSGQGRSRATGQGVILQRPAAGEENRERSADGSRRDDRRVQELPLGAKAKVTNLETGKTADVKINDRGPVPKSRVIDVSKQAANQLGIKQEQGVAPVKVEAKPADQPTAELKQKVEQAAKH
jgi:rare lipoprotein A